jgi:serine/threonine protein kinase
MTDLIKFLSTNSPAALGLSIAFLIAGITISILYTVAFVQGRSVSFWPPSIGEKPASRAPDKSKGVESTVDEPKPANPPVEPQNPIVDRGTVVRGASGKSYRITSTYYGGANATLYKAVDPQENTVIAKVFWRGLAPNSPSWDLFQQEQRAAEILNHRNIVKTLDRGLRSGYPFTVMEFLGGGTLRDWLQTHHRLPGKDIVSIASQVADAIDYAHSQGVIHRDIKPGNVLFEAGPEGRVALSDFGIAAIMGAVEHDITAVGGEFTGTPGYIAPEVIQGGQPTRQADIYGFGVVFYEMISGCVPFGENVEVWAVLRAKLERDAPDVRQFRPEVDEGIALRLSQALARDPALRPASACGVLTGIEDRLRSL